MFGIGGPELIVILLILLLFVGPDKLPQVIKTVGSGVRDLRRAANLAQHELRQSMEELSREVEAVTKDVTDLAQEQAAELRAETDLHGTGAAPPSRPPPRVAAEGETIAVVPRRMAALDNQTSDSAGEQEVPRLTDGAHNRSIPLIPSPVAPAEPAAALAPTFNRPGLTAVAGARPWGASLSMGRSPPGTVVGDPHPVGDRPPPLPSNDLPPPLPSSGPPQPLALTSQAAADGPPAPRPDIAPPADPPASTQG